MKETCAWAKKVDKIVFRAMWGVSILSGASLMLVALICTIDALGAKIFSVSVPNGTEWVTYLNIPVVFLAIGFIQVERGHTTVDLISGRFPEVIQKIIRAIGNLLGIFVCAYVGYCSWKLTLDKIATSAKASSAAGAFLVWPFALVIAVGFLLLMLAFVWTLIREFVLPPHERMGGMPPELQQMEEEAIK